MHNSELMDTCQDWGSAPLDFQQAVFLPPTLEKLRGHIGLGLSVHLSVCP